MVLRTVLIALVLSAATGLSASAVAKTRTSDVCDSSLAVEFLGVLGRLDFDAAGSFLDEKAVLELPYVNDGLIVRGRANILEFFRQSMGQATTSIEYTVEQAYTSPQAGALILELSTQGRTAAGREYSNYLIAIFKCRGGKILLFREYFNPANVK